MSPPPPTLLLRGARVDLAAGRAVRDDGAEVHLTPTECALLRFLAEHPDEVLSRDALLQAVWGYRKGVKSRALDTAVKTLRRKVERDPRQPDHIHTVRGIGYRFEPRRDAARRRPVQDALVGRDDDLALASLAVDTHPVTTLVGPAGIGKTSLARALLAQRQGLFVDLSHATTTDDVLTTVAAAISPGRALGDADAVGAHLHTLDVGLWVLDNCEQAATPLRSLLGGWRRQAPDARWLLTSRVPLGLGDEHAQAVGPLQADDAVALLLARGAARRPAFADSAPDVLHSIADAVDRVPLALELVAARAGLLDASALRDRLVRLDWLRDDQQTPRHRTLAEAVAWSWSLLGDDARATLSAASLFAGPFTVEGVEVIRGSRRGAVLDELEQLVDASLVQRVEGGPALELLVMVRAFASEQLQDRSAAEDRLTDWLLERLEDADPDALVRYRDTARGLLPGQRDRRPGPAARLALDIVHGLASTGPMAARLDAADAAVALADAAGDDAVRTQAFLERARAREAIGGVGSDDLHAARAAADRTGDPVLRGRARGRLGTWLLGRGELDAADVELHASLALLEQAGDLRSQADRHSNLALTASLRGHHAQALERYRRALALHEEVGNRLHAAKVMSGLGAVYLHMGRPDRAVRWFEQAQQVHHEIDHAPGMMRSAGNLAVIAHSLGQLDLATREFARTRELARQLGEPLIEGVVELNCTALALEHSDIGLAERHAARGRVLLERVRAGAYLARLRLWEAVVLWTAAEPKRARDTLQVAIGELEGVGDRRSEARARGLRHVWTRQDDDLPALARDAASREEPLTVAWLELCGAAADADGTTGADVVKRLEAFARGDACHETDLRILARLVGSLQLG